MENLPDLLRSAAADTAALGATAADFETLTAPELLAAQEVVTALRRCADRYAALVASAITHRSRPEYGHAGLAQAAGFVSPVAMLQSTAGISRLEAVKLVQVGTMIAETEARTTLTQAAGDQPASDQTVGGEPGDAALESAPTLPPELSADWQAPLVNALSSGALSLDAVEAIRRGFGDIDPTIGTDAMLVAVQHVVDGSVGLTVEQVYRRAR